MAQFIVYENTSRIAKKIYPYLLDIQSDLLNELKTTVIIPLSPREMETNNHPILLVFLSVFCVVVTVT